MRIVSWNVNGLRKLWPLEKLFERLDADIVCFQETRISGEWDPNLESLAFVKGYDSFFSICKEKRGYSGVATFCRKQFATPIDAGEGLSSNVGGASISFNDDGTCGECVFEDCPCEKELCTQKALAMIEEEGRCVVTDHQRFVLINVYIPAVSVEGRAAFKMQFLHGLYAKVAALRLRGRKVIIAGDFNICPELFDSAEPIPASERKFWEKRPSRQWLHRLTSAHGLDLVDSFRKMHPSVTNAFTCWSEATRARENNHGVRIDLIVMDRSLFAEVERADICPEIHGSDHCPVMVLLKQREHELEIPQAPPKFCTRYMRRFSVRQKSLRDILVQGSKAGRSGPEVVRAISPGPNRNDSPLSLTAPMRNRQGVSSSGQNIRKRKGKQASISTFFPRNTTTGIRKCRIPRQPDPPDIQGLKGNSLEDMRPAPNGTTRRKESARAWRKLLSGPPPPPLCRHGERCVLKTVTKPGENKGRTFFSCPYPAGVGKTADCSFFKWAPFTAGNGILPR